MQVQLSELLHGGAIVLCQMVGGHTVAQGDAVVVPGLLVADALGEITFRMAGHLAGGHELSIEVPGGEAERRPLVLLDDAADIVAVLRLGASHAALAVIVGRDGQRPAAEPAMGRREIACRAIGGQDRVEAIVDLGVDVHVVLTPGLRHELPDAARADARTRVDLEGGLDVRQEGQILGDAVTAHDLAEGLIVASADLHAAAELFADAALGAHAL